MLLEYGIEITRRYLNSEWPTLLCGSAKRELFEALGFSHHLLGSNFKGFLFII